MKGTQEFVRGARLCARMRRPCESLCGAVRTLIKNIRPRHFIQKYVMIRGALTVSVASNVCSAAGATVSG